MTWHRGNTHQGNAIAWHCGQLKNPTDSDKSEKKGGIYFLNGHFCNAKDIHLAQEFILQVYTNNNLEY